MRRCSKKTWIAGCLLAGIVLGPVSAPPVAAAEKKPKKITYDEHVKPILRQKCFACHNPDTKSSGLDLTTYTNLMLGGASGEVIDPGSAADSYLYMVVNHETEPYMPPNSDKLPAEMLAIIKAWIDGGAPENAGSKPLVSKKPKMDFSLKSAPTGKPEGPPPMPERLSLAPVVHTATTSAVTALATSPWAPLAAVAGQKQVLLYNTQTLELLGVLPFPEGVPHVLKFSRSGGLLLAGGGQGGALGRVVVWNVKTGERVFEVGDELDVVLAADISADQSMIALGGPARVVRVYSTADSKLLYELRKHTDWIHTIEFSPDGVLLATGDRSGGVLVWEARTGREYLNLVAHKGAISSVSWRIDSNVLATASEDASIRLWEMHNGKQIKNWNAHGGGTASVEFARDGRVVSCGRDRVAKLWDQNGKQVRAFPAFSDLALEVTYCDEMNRVIAGDWTGTVRVWNAADGKPVGELTPNPRPLEERLAEARNVFAARQTEQKKAADAYNAAKAAAEKVKADLAAANQAVSDLDKQTQTATTSINGLKQALSKADAAHAAATKTVQSLEAVIPLLAETAAKAEQTAAKLPDDKELAAAAAQFKTLREKWTATFEAARKAAVDQQAQIGKIKPELAKAEKALTETNKALEAARKRAADLTAALKAADQKAAAAKQAVDAAAQATRSAQLELKRWQQEIEFTQKLAVLSERRDEYESLAIAAAEAQAAVDQMQGELDQATQAASAAQAEVDAASKAVAGAKQALAAATAAQAAQQQQVASLEAALPLVKEALEKGRAAAQKAADDQDLAATAQQLKAVVDKKSAELETLRKVLADKLAAVEKSKQALAAAEQKAQQAVAAVEAARQVVAEKTAALKPLAEKAQAARQAADAAQKTVEVAEREVDVLKGKTPPAGQAQASASR